MTAPHQVAPPDLAALVGMGAFQVGDAAKNWGQEVNEGFVRTLIKGPAAALGSVGANVPAFLGGLGAYLSTLPLEALRLMKEFIPDALEGAFDTVEGAVAAILAAFNVENGLMMLVSDFNWWLGQVFHFLQTEVNQFFDAINGLIVVPITERVGAFLEWLWSRHQYEITTTVNLGNLANGFTGLLSGVTPPDLPDTPEEALAALEGVVGGAVSEMGKFLNDVHQGVTGAVNNGINTTTAMVLGAFDGARRNAVNLQDQINQLFGLIPPKTTAIGAVYVDNVARESTVSSNDWGDPWTIVAATGTTHANGAAIVWDDAGHSARFVMGKYNTPTKTPYQTVQLSLAAQPEQPLPGENPCSNMLIANAKADFSEFVYAEFYWNKIEIGYYDGGVDNWHDSSKYHVFPGAVDTSTGGKPWPLGGWSFKAGTEASPYQYVISFGAGDGAQQLAYTDTTMKVAADDDHRDSGMALFSHARGSSEESTPGAVSLWLVKDSSPTAMIGSGMRAYRTSTTPVTVNSSAIAPLPGSFFDNLEYCSADMHWNASTGVLTVDEPGMYSVTVCVGFAAHEYDKMVQASVWRNGSFYLSGNSHDSTGGSSNLAGTVTAGLAAGSPVDVSAPPRQFGLRGVWFTFPVRIVNAGDSVQPGVWSQTVSGSPAPAAVSVCGESTGSITWFSAMKVNP